MTTPDPALYRPCAGLMIVNRASRVFVGKRIDTKEGDWWQMPQGGVDPGEDPDDAAFRELHEETGIARDKVEIIARSEQELFYDLPEELQGKLWSGKFIGQRQSWFLMRFLGEDADIDLNVHDPAEFLDYRWTDPELLPEMIIPFKRPVYSAVLEMFRPHL
ncbi:RNA pyrophosphohydrolase [Croceicoccus naphthovorans]|uniref:RNA pyrophosphohydrolase n=1 Tax=Croceicoccus naphthovorans TaxID=1348774 RepID=A0A0G3XJP5_9SPHN|nr:RNA pyrophosphohydrolase [Croceicoccus naphthovorans]AKM11780.1 RNA pyrophosphohydrolase [Croceicoccus naphthovorans]MBB3988634.1 putative (di)nucleoside polyphosphate hydrolase [Croceicoccus naphthovorans]